MSPTPGRGGGGREAAIWHRHAWEEGARGIRSFALLTTGSEPISFDVDVTE